MMGDNGKDPQAKPDPNNPKVVNSVTLIEIRVHKLDNGKEKTEVIGQEFMMCDHKVYMIDKLIEAMRIVNHAIRRKPLIHTASQISNVKLKQLWNNIKRKKNLKKGGSFGKE